MMLSDELRRATKTKSLNTEEWISIMTVLPRVVALERCRELLEKYCFIGDGWCLECHKANPHHAPDCEISKALKADHE